MQARGIQLRAGETCRPRFLNPNRRCVVRTHVSVKETGSVSLQGTTRKYNEDRLKIQEFPAKGAMEPFFFAGVFDGHGGNATAEWLKEKLYPIIEKAWGAGPPRPEATMEKAFVEADKQLLKPGGFMGMGERGVGGSKCGSTAATVLIYKDKEGADTLLTANLGDARILLIRDGEGVQMTVDHVPDSEEERERIERTNPNPKLPLVRYVGGTWRVGGMLALSRAFGDAYMKGSLQFEGITEPGNDGYGSGFGLVAQPYCTTTALGETDSYIVISSDGLYSEETRGGGGGLDNETVAKMCMSMKDKPCAELAAKLADAAVEAGSTDDVTVIVVKLA